MNEEPYAELDRLRGSIDNLDSCLVHLLAERFKVTQRVGELKAAHGLPPADPEREQRQITRLRALAEESKLDPEFAEKVLNFIVREVVRHHAAIAAERQGDFAAERRGDFAAERRGDSAAGRPGDSGAQRQGGGSGPEPEGR